MEAGIKNPTLPHDDHGTLLLPASGDLGRRTSASNGDLSWFLPSVRVRVGKGGGKGEIWGQYKDIGSWRVSKYSEVVVHFGIIIWGFLAGGDVA